MYTPGTMTFGEQNSLPQSFGLLDEAFNAGINFFDSAEMFNFSLLALFFQIPFYLPSILSLFQLLGIRYLNVLRLREGAKSTLAVGLNEGKSRGIALS